MSKAPAHKPAPAEPAAAHKTLHKRLSELCVDEIISYREAKKLSLDEQKVSALYMPCGKCSTGKSSKRQSLSYIRVADAVHSIADGKAERLYCMCIEQNRRSPPLRSCSSQRVSAPTSAAAQGRMWARPCSARRQPLGCATQAMRGASLVRTARRCSSAGRASARTTRHSHGTCCCHPCPLRTQGCASFPCRASLSL